MQNTGARIDGKSNSKRQIFWGKLFLRTRPFSVFGSTCQTKWKVFDPARFFGGLKEKWSSSVLIDRRKRDEFVPKKKLLSQKILEKALKSKVSGFKRIKRFHDYL